MDDVNKENLDAEVQDADGANSDDNASVNGFQAAKIAEDQKRRAEKAEQEAKELKAKLAQYENKQEEKPASSASITEDDILIVSKLQDKDKIAKLRKIAAVEELSLSEAMNSDLFKAWEKNYDAERKAEQASLGASKGSGTATKQKDFNTPGLQKEDHKAMWKKSQGI